MTPDLPTAPPWLDDAACIQVDADLFFPDPGRQDMTRAAKRICADCDVRLPCLELALTNNEWGVWGGLADDERRALQGKRRRHG